MTRGKLTGRDPASEMPVLLRIAKDLASCDTEQRSEAWWMGRVEGWLLVLGVDTANATLPEQPQPRPDAVERVWNVLLTKYFPGVAWWSEWAKANARANFRTAIYGDGELPKRDEHVALNRAVTAWRESRDEFLGPRCEEYFKDGWQARAALDNKGALEKAARAMLTFLEGQVIGGSKYREARDGLRAALDKEESSC